MSLSRFCRLPAHRLACWLGLLLIADGVLPLLEAVSAKEQSAGLCLAQKAPRASHPGGAQTAGHPDRAYTPRSGSPEESAILDALRQARPYLRRPVQAALLVDTIKVHHGWAYLSATPTAPGNQADAPHYAHEDVLLRQVRGRWKFVYAFDPVDDTARSVQKARARYPAAPRDIFPRP